MQNVISSSEMSVEEKMSPTSSTAAPKRKREMRLTPPLERKNSQTEAGSAKPTTLRQPLPKLLLHNNPAKVGKANLKRDIPIFLGILGFLLLQAYLLNDVGKPSNTNDKKDKKKTLQDMQQVLRKQLEESHARELARKRTMECDLFLATSSIPGAGLGIFAGKRFEAGAEVVSTMRLRFSSIHYICHTLMNIWLCFINCFRCTRDSSFPCSIETMAMSIFMSLNTDFCSSTTRFWPTYKVDRLGVRSGILIAQVSVV